MVGPNSPPTNELFDALSSDRRRRILSILQETERTTTEELSRRIAALETEDDAGGTSRTDRTEVSVSLVHNHLPRLSDIALVEYDARAGTVGRGEAFETVLPIVERTRSLGDETEGTETNEQLPSSDTPLPESVTTD